MNVINRIIINCIISSNIILGRYKSNLYKLFGINIGGEIRNNVYFNSKNIIIGENGFINDYVKFYSGFDSESNIIIEDKVWIGMNTTICCISHNIGNNTQRAGVNTYKKIRIGEGSWIGANCFIGQGVTVGKGCVIGAGSVVLKDCDANCLYGGNPAKKIRELD